MRSTWLTGSYDNWLMVVVKESDTDGLMFDGQPFSTLGPQWSSFPGKHKDNRKCMQTRYDEKI